MSKSTIITAAAAVSAAAVIGGGFAAASLLAGGGAQPEDVLPGNTLAFVKVDMDPAAGQKVNAYRLAKKFESVDVSSKDDLKDSLLEPLFADTEGVDYAKDVKPWIGDRAAVAAVPDAENGAVPLVVIEFTEEEEMEAGLTKIKAASASETNYETLPPDGADLTAEPEPTTVESDMAWAVRDGFVLISEDQATVDAAAKATDLLVDDADYTADIAALDGDQIVTSWVDLEATYAAIPEGEAGNVLGFGTGANEPKPTGSIVLGVSAQSDHVEFVAKSLDVKVEGMPVVSAEPGTGMVADFPADTVAALSIAGLGKTMSTLHDTLVESGVDLSVPPELAEQYGITLPDDLVAVFGTDLAAGVRMGSVDDFDVFGKVRTANPDRAVGLAEAVIDDFGLGEDLVFTEARGDHYVAGSSTEALDLPGAGGLGNDATFNKVVEDADTAAAVGFVDIAALVDLFMTPEDEEYGDVKPLDAFGFSVTGDGANSTMTARLSLR
jgi:hypothetical protein